MRVDAETLERLYLRFNRRECVSPDPLQLLYAYEDPADREVAALVASSLAFGRVAGILKSASAVLEAMGRPAEFLRKTPPARLRRTFSGFRHRFADGGNLAGLLAGARRVLLRFGSLQAGFAAGVEEGAPDSSSALEAFVARVASASGVACGCLLPSPAGGSACKRLNLMLRWLVRRDEVDPGDWSCLKPSQLIVPLDTHMHRIARALGMTSRRSADLKCAREVTAAFARFSPGDPVRYDFALTRQGIQGRGDLGEFLEG